MVAVAFVLGCNSAGRSNVQKVGGVLAVDPPSVDFGDVALGKEARKTVFVRNDGIVAMRVDQLAAQLDDSFSYHGLPCELGPGAVQPVEVVYHPHERGLHAGNVELVTTAPGGPTGALELHGNAVLGLATLSADAIDFGEVVVNESATQALWLSNNDGHAETSVQVAGASGGNAASFSVDQSGVIALGSEQSLGLNIRFSPDHLGAFSAQLNLTPCPTCQPRAITLTGKGVERLVDVAPGSIDFGDVQLGSKAIAQFTLQNTSNRTVTIKELRVQGGADLSAALGIQLPYALGAGQSLQGTAQFAPVTLGAQTGSVTFVPDDGGAPVLQLAGLGMGAVVQTKPHQLYVGATAVGTTRTGKLVISNVGLDPHAIAPLRIALALAQSDGAWTLQTPATVDVGEPGAQTTVSVAFTPTAAGDSNATLDISSNDGLHPHVQIPLSALGRVLQPCTLGVAPGNPVDFGTDPLFHPTTQGFELTNQTADDCVVGDPELTGDPAFRWPGGVAPGGRTLPPGGRMSVRVEFQPEQAGSFRGAVQFYVSNKNAPSLRVDLAGAGSAGCFFVTPGAVDFGAATQGCSAPNQTAYLVNQCAGPVTVTQVATSGAPFGLSNVSTPMTIAPNTNAAVAITYQAATPGDDVGSLLVQTAQRAQPYKVGLTAGSQEAANVTDTWNQSTPKVDLLMVIDNSGSMAEEHQALQANLQHLWDRIALANADFHIAVTTTGMQPYTAGWTQCPGGAQGGEGGRFFPVDNSRPRILTPQTPNVKDVLFANVDVGLCHWDERFLEPAVAALTDPLISSTKAPGTPWPADGNAGFLRDDARLALLAFSDANDYDDVPNPPPVATQVAQLVGAKHGAKDLISFSGIVALQACSTIESVGTRYQEIAKELNGTLYDICDLTNMGAMLDNAIGDLMQPLTSFQLSTRPRDPRTIAVTINGAPTSNFTYDATTNRIVFPKSAPPAPGTQIAASYGAACN